MHPPTRWWTSALVTPTRNLKPQILNPNQTTPNPKPIADLLLLIFFIFFYLCDFLFFWGRLNLFKRRHDSLICGVRELRRFTPFIFFLRNCRTEKHFFHFVHEGCSEYTKGHPWPKLHEFVLRNCRKKNSEAGLRFSKTFLSILLVRP